jgi:hypothetical protein
MVDVDVVMGQLSVDAVHWTWRVIMGQQVSRRHGCVVKQPGIRISMVSPAAKGQAAPTVLMVFAVPVS